MLGPLLTWISLQLRVWPSTLPAKAYSNIRDSTSKAERAVAGYWPLAGAPSQKAS